MSHPPRCGKYTTHSILLYVIILIILGAQHMSLCSIFQLPAPSSFLGSNILIPILENLLVFVKCSCNERNLMRQETSTSKISSINKIFFVVKIYCFKIKCTMYYSDMQPHVQNYTEVQSKKLFNY